MANRPAPANSGMLAPRTKKPMNKANATSKPFPKVGEKKKMSNNTSSGAVSYSEAKSKLKKMMRGGM